MNKRRYDEVIALVASVLFGIAAQDFAQIASGLRTITFSLEASCLTAAALFLVFFRNIHGLISYDAWAENSAYYPPFEGSYGRRARFFVYAVLVVILSPYFALFCLKNLPQKSIGLSWCTIALASKPWQLVAVLALPLVLYIPWDVRWYLEMKHAKKKAPPRDLAAEELEDFVKARDELFSFTKRWVLIDAVGVVAFVLLWLVFLRNGWSAQVFCWIFASLAVLMVISDYLTHLRYYFPIALESSKQNRIPGQQQTT
jgi:hypothetical protein